MSVPKRIDLMSQLPRDLQYAIEEELNSFSLTKMVRGREHLTERYRQKTSFTGNFISTEEQRYAYIATRLPATYGVMKHLFQEIERSVSKEEIQTLLDLGAGPGSVMWAADTVFSGINKIFLLEKDSALSEWGKRLGKYSSSPAISAAQWELCDFTQKITLPQCDLVVFSYSVGELPATVLLPTVKRAWEACHKFLVIVEPGTPTHFERVRLIRKYLIEEGAHMVAPCPHTRECPMSHGNWCHFYTRIERSFLHKRIKEGALGHEDEKFSYLIFSKIPHLLSKPRVLSFPLKRSGHVELTLCGKEGLVRKTISKKTPEAYRQARKLEWGDLYEDSISNKP